MIKKSFLIWIGCMALLSGCAQHNHTFLMEEPRQSLNDAKPIAEPERDDFYFREYLISSTVRHPLINHLDVKRIPESGDVNSHDELVESSWFTRRLGYQNLSAQDLLQGPISQGPPQKPLTVTKIKKKGTALGFHIKDSRGLKYLVKMENKDHPGLQPMVNVVANRLFWGFGYNVPEDFILRFNRSDLRAEAGGKVNQSDIDHVLNEFSGDSVNEYVTMASLFVEGKVLGHVAQKGTRKNDPNDLIPHENLRALRALYVFCSWLQQTGIRSDNTLDVYQEQQGGGFIKHYLIDFDEALGVHGLQYGYKWEGHQHMFHWDELAERYVKLGFPAQPWEKIETSVNDVRTYFEVEQFNPSDWKEVWPFQPIRHHTPADNYWAAKVVGSVSESVLRGLFESTGYQGQELIDYYVETLMQRREKLLKHHLFQVSPLEVSEVKADILRLEDRAMMLLENVETYDYRIRYFSGNNKKIGDALTVPQGNATFDIPLRESRDDYLRIEVELDRQSSDAKAAEFHLRRNGAGAWKLVGVVH